MSPVDGELDQLTPDGEPPEFDLTPNSTRKSRTSAGNRKSRLMALGVLIVLVAAAGFLVSKALGGATTYFYRVDQAVANQNSLGTRRFRIQGTVMNAPQGTKITNNQQRITFRLSANNISVPVVYEGSDPPALFQKCEPVLLVGSWASKVQGAKFVGDEIIIKHTESYTAEHANRLKDGSGCK